MGIRRQIYLDEGNDHLLKEQSRRTGLSVSELIRQAVQQCYGARRRLSWDEVFSRRVAAGSAISEQWTYDPLFDEDIDDLLDDQITGDDS